MYTKLILSLFTAALLVGDVSAQSSGRNNNAAAQRKQERLEAADIQKIAKKIEKNNFAGIKLETEQKRALKQMVKDNYEKLTAVQQKMQRLVPEDKADDLKRKYNTFVRKGSTEAEAMLASMQAVEFPEPLQEQMMALSGESDVLVDEIATELSGQLNAEQKEIYAAMVAAKGKEKMTGEEGGNTEEGDDAETGGQMTDGKTMGGDEAGESEPDEDSAEDDKIESDGSDSK